MIPGSIRLFVSVSIMYIYVCICACVIDVYSNFLSDFGSIQL